MIPGVSPELAREIAQRYPDPELLKGASPSDLGTVPGMKEDVARRVLELVRAASTADASWYREEPALYLCPECGSFVGKGSNACPFCGVVFDEGEAAPGSQSPVEELLRARNGEAKICTRCGAFLEPGATACGMCGSEYGADRLAELPAVDTTPIPEGDLFLCPHCGAFLGQGDTACAICGSAVEKEARIPGLVREGRGVSKDFLSRWQRAAAEETPAAPAPPAPRTLEDELQEYERLLEADPVLERAWVHKGRILAQLGRTEEAVACFDRAARIDPENEDAYRLEVLGLLGPAPDLSVLPPRWKEAQPAPAPADDLLKELEEGVRAEPVPTPPTTPPEVARPVVVPPQVAPAPERVAEPSPVSTPEPAVEMPPVRALPSETPAIRRALSYYDRLIAMDSGLRVAWQTKGELLLRLGRKDDAEECFRRAADLEVAEREFGRAALTGLQTRGPVRPATARGGAPAGRTNGRVNGLTNGRRGRTNGRVNGLTNGSGATNGLTNGLGRVNGLMSGLARGEGRTNGLVNGNGFTNGRRGRAPAALPSQGRAWTRSVAGIAAVVLLMILAPILASMLTATPVARGIVIDGSFGDWGSVPVLYSDRAGDTRGNPDVDLVGYKVAAGLDSLSVYTRVQGQAFRGSGNATDVLVALLDTDKDPKTGYDVGGFGADYMVELVGWDARVQAAPLYRFHPGANRTDWFSFDPAGYAAAAASGSETEFTIGIDKPESARVLLATVDGLGRTDISDAVVVPGKPALGVVERGIAPGVIVSTTRVPVLQLNLTPAGLPVAISYLNLTKRGSLPDAAISLTLYRDDGDGVFTTSDVPLGTASVTQGRASFPIALTLAQPATVFVAADLAVLPANETFGVAFRDISANGFVSLTSADLTLSYLASAPAPTVDGAFADWAGIPRSVDPVGDVANRTGVSTVMNANVDLTEVGSFLSQNVSFYLRVDGAMLGGVDVPNLRARTPPPAPLDTDRDGVPDVVDPMPYDFNNDNITDANSLLPNGLPDVDRDGIADYPSGPDYWLNTTIPAWFPAPYANRNVSVYIGPIAPTTLQGVDSAIVYLDGDNRSATGLPVTFGYTTYGLDWAIVVVGRNGAVFASELYRYRAGSGIPWALVQNVPAAVDGSHLEVSVPNALLNLSADYRTAYYATDWQLSYDVALPVPPGRSAGLGTRSPLGNNVVINEVSPRPNPEWIELANPTAGSIALAGWTIERMLGGNRWTTIYAFPAGSSIGAWGSGLEYLGVDLAPNSLPNGGDTIRLRDAAGTTVDATTYPNIANARSWSRFKDPTTGKPMDSDNDAADFYTSLLPSKGGPNDRHRPTVVVAKTANRSTAAPGDQITYTVYYNNTNTGRANHVWMNDTLPAQVTFVSSSVPPGSFSGQVYRWHFTNVGPNTLNSLTITVRVNDGTGNGVVLVNRADLSYKDQLDRNMGTSSAWRNVSVSRPVITVAKIGDKTTALPGDTIVYTIYYNNTGSASALHVWINDTLPSGVTYVSSSVPPTSSSGQTYRWHFMNVAVGAHSFTITVQVNSNPGTSLLVNWVFLNYTTQSGYKLEESRASWTTSIPEFSDFALVAVIPLVFLGLRRLRRTRKE